MPAHDHEEDTHELMVDTDELVEHLLRTYGTITVVGASATAAKKRPMLWKLPFTAIG